jgi:hypothetical protein
MDTDKQTQVQTGSEKYGGTASSYTLAGVALSEMCPSDTPLLGSRSSILWAFSVTLQQHSLGVIVQTDRKLLTTNVLCIHQTDTDMYRQIVVMATRFLNTIICHSQKLTTYKNSVIK